MIFEFKFGLSFQVYYNTFISPSQFVFLPCQNYFSSLGFLLALDRADYLNLKHQHILQSDLLLNQPIHSSHCPIYTSSKVLYLIIICLIKFYDIDKCFGLAT